MIPVYQTIFKAGSGDCFSACLASLLELPLDSIPKFRRDETKEVSMMDAARTWLKERFGLSIITVQMAEEVETGTDYRIINAFSDTPCIAGGVSPNNPGGHHAVVGVINDLEQFTMTHDPNPSNLGIVGDPVNLYFLVPMNPAKNIFRPGGYLHQFRSLRPQQ